MTEQITIHLDEDGADAERLEKLALHLRRDLLELDVEDVKRAPGGPAPDDTRAVDVAAVGALLVTVAGIGTNLNDIITLVRGWLAASRGTPRTVKVTLGGDTLELSGASLADQNRLVDLFVEKHRG